MDLNEVAALCVSIARRLWPFRNPPVGPQNNTNLTGNDKAVLDPDSAPHPTRICYTFSRTMEQEIEQLTVIICGMNKAVISFETALARLEILEVVPGPQQCVMLGIKGNILRALGFDDEAHEAFQIAQQLGLSTCAELGNSYAQWALGNMYEFGFGVEKNLDLAHDWYTLSANQGNTRGKCALGSLHLSRKIDQVRGFELLASSARDGHALAQLNLVYAFDEGLGTNRNIDESIQACLLSAEQGQQDAQLQLGHLFEHSIHLPRNLALARMWYLRSALQGNENAQMRLCDMYFEGRGVRADRVKAKFWHDQAEWETAKDRPRAIERLRFLRQHAKHFI